MADVQIVFRPPLDFVARQHGAFRRQLEDLTGLWRRFIPLVAAMEAQWFASHGDGAWPPLAESTVKRKQARGLSLEPLRSDDRQGSLYDTLVDPQLAAVETAHSLIWSTGVPYAHWHQDGGSMAGRPPKRQVIPDPLPVEHRRQFEVATVSWVNEAAAAAFGSVR